jgi:hypothetical protein
VPSIRESKYEYVSTMPEMDNIIQKISVFLGESMYISRS